MNGLGYINIELTSRCNKSCWMCGRRKIEKEYPNLADWGDMEFSLLLKIADQLPKGIVVQFHNNGESLLYPRFGEAIRLFNKQIKCIDTNGKLLVEKADEIIGNLDTLTISVIQDDSEGDEQFEIVKAFLNMKDANKPLMVYRLLGEIENRIRWKTLPGIIANRILHNPMGSFDYKKKTTKPEIGICLDLLNHLVINRYGYVSPCVRFDPHKWGVIGNANITSLSDIWNGAERKEWLRWHLQGRRDEIQLCRQCDYWGVPTG